MKESLLFRYWNHGATSKTGKTYKTVVFLQDPIVTFQLKAESRSRTASPAWPCEAEPQWTDAQGEGRPALFV